MYDEEMWSEFSDSDIMLWLLLAAISLYPVLADCGAGFTAPLQILCAEETFRGLLTCMREWGTTAVHSLGALPKDFRRAFMEIPENNTLIFLNSPSRYLADNLEFLFDACVESLASGEPQSILLVFSDSRVRLPKGLAFAGTIRLQGTSKEVPEIFGEFRQSLINTTLKEQSWLMDRLRGIADGDDEMSAFRCASMCVRLALTQEGTDRETVGIIEEKMETAIHILNDNWDGNSDPDAMMRLFWKRMEDYILRSRADIRAYNRMDVPDKEMPVDLSDTVLYDAEAYYIGSPLFALIVGEGDFSCNRETLEEIFAENGFLHTEGVRRRYLTKDVTMISSEGYSYRKRMMKFNRSVMDSLGDFSLLELIEMRGGMADGY